MCFLVFLGVLETAVESIGERGVSRVIDFCESFIFSFRSLGFHLGWFKGVRELFLLIYKRGNFAISYVVALAIGLTMIGIRLARCLEDVSSKRVSL